MKLEPLKRQCGSRQCNDDLDELFTTDAGKQKLIAEVPANSASK